MPPLSDVGFITMAFGPQKYLDQAKTLAASIKRWMPAHKLAIVTDVTEPGPEFDFVIPMASFGTAGTIHKTDLYDYSPFDETFFIDSDCVVAKDFSVQLAQIRAHDFSPVCTTYLRPGDRDLWLEDVGAALAGVGGTLFPKFNGGVYFYRKSEHAAEVFRRAAALRSRAEELGIKNFDRAGPGEETLIGLALAEMGVPRLYDDGGHLMRTPLNSSGTIVLDVLNGRCHFTKEGHPVTPAICHFCGDWIAHPAYVIARRELETAAPASPVFKGRLHASMLAKQFGQRVARKLSRKARAA